MTMGPHRGWTPVRLWLSEQPRPQVETGHCILSPEVSSLSLKSHWEPKCGHSPPSDVPFLFWESPELVIGTAL